MSFTGNFLCDSLNPGLVSGGFDFSPATTDTYYVALYTNNATLDNTTTAYTTAGEVVAGGYTAGGNVITPTYYTESGGAYISFANTSWNGILTARGALIYKPGDNGAICVLDFGADRTSTTTFTVQFPPATAGSALIRLP
jgi:hypothetical protein